MIDLKTLKELVKLMSANDLTELDLQDQAGERVTLKRGSSGAPVQYVQAPAAHAAPQLPGAQAAQAAAPVAASGGGGNDGLTPIPSPMVGTFYAAATPDAKAFVSVGDSVDAETVVCIIEAMKVFNEIKAETSGVIERVMITNGQAVEFGQPLFMIKPR